MGNLVSSFLSGFGKFIDKLFGSPLDFLAGKSCSSICGSTWNFICYIENFCVVHLLKLAAVSVLFYFVLLFFYLLYKLGICQCICRSLCKMAWACFATCFSVLEYGCSYLCYKLPTLRRKQRRHKRDFKEFTTSSTDDEMEAEDKSFSYHVPRRSRRRDYKGNHLRRSLRPRSHRIQVGIIGDSTYASKRNSIKNGHHGRSVHDVRVTRTSKFAQKSGSYKGSTHRMRRRK